MIQIDCFNSDPLTFDDKHLAIFNLVSTELEATKVMGPLILGLGEENLEVIMRIISSRQQQVIITIKSKKDFKLIPLLKIHFSKIFGFIDLNGENSIAEPLIRNYLNLNFTKQAIGLEKLSNDLSHIEEQTHSQLRGIKEIYDRFVKIRTEKVKGAELFVKFMAGEKSGGEFFDYIALDSQMFFIQAGSDSYLMSSLIISAMEDLKTKNIDFNNSINSFMSNLKFYAKENNASLSFTIMILKLKTMEAEIYSSGMSKIFYNQEIISLNDKCIIKLKRGERITFISEGTFLNWQKYHEVESLSKFLTSNLELNNKDFINEIFFELSRHKKGMFLFHDALVAMLEIDENVLLQL